MDERRLGYFLAVVEEGSITAAAARMHIAQPSLSQSVRGFEAELGVELFHRVGRGLRVSSAGDALVGPARQVLRAMDAARDAIAGVAEVQTGRLEIAALATLATDPLAELIGAFRESYPGVEVRVLEPDSADGVGSLVRDGTCELGAAHLPLPVGRLGVGPLGGRLASHPLGEQQMLFVFPPADTAGPTRPIGARELARTPLVVSPPGTSTRILLEQALAAVGVTPQVAVETAAREAIVALVLSGAGAALLPAPLAREAERRGATVRPAQPRITRTVGIVHRDGPLSPAARAFLALATAPRERGRPGVA